MNDDRKGRYRLTAQNPVPRRANEEANEPIGQGGMDMAEDGYVIIDRANARNRYDNDRRGIAPAVRDGYDDDTRWGNLT
jgi:hypothetical protein